MVVLFFTWGIVLAAGEHHALGSVSRHSLLFLVLSGLATGLSWVFYFKALQLGTASHVAPIDKLSLALTLLLAWLILKEPLTWQLVVGTLLIIGGALLTLK